MEYDKFPIGDNVYWVANPKNWKELGEAIQEDMFLPFDPNNIPSASQKLIDMFTT